MSLDGAGSGKESSLVGSNFGGGGGSGTSSSDEQVWHMKTTTDVSSTTPFSSSSSSTALVAYDDSYASRAASSSASVAGAKDVAASAICKPTLCKSTNHNDEMEKALPGKTTFDGHFLDRSYNPFRI